MKQIDIKDKVDIFLEISFQDRYGCLKDATFLRLGEYDKIKNWCIKKGYLEFLLLRYQE